MWSSDALGDEVSKVKGKTFYSISRDYAVAISVLGAALSLIKSLLPSPSPPVLSRSRTPPASASHKHRLLLHSTPFLDGLANKALLAIPTSKNASPTNRRSVTCALGVL
jgi:hypothetical protein